MQIKRNLAEDDGPRATERELDACGRSWQVFCGAQDFGFCLSLHLSLRSPFFMSRVSHPICRMLYG